ncbi:MULTISPECIES: GntR family transcriptional regulator [unclassified Brevibacterium]|uniref:FadR/GntR family transcriptional regulator n=1 Tax=unclassified Brevibacterium TaxID=2614124 RepID=UPI002016C29C|nr:GntR family transcriptional regulator [Brevibacterium sp. 2SA]MCM1013202.1 GntR family transcriptional regulator [Brevibacterium sp. XM4083]
MDRNADDSGGGVGGKADVTADAGATEEADVTEAAAGSQRPARLRGGNVFEHTIAELLRAIRLGQYLVGDKLPPERELAARINVSRATLRQALSELQTAGVVSVRRGRYGGTFVTRLPAADREAGIDLGELDDAVRFRLILDTAAARVVAARELSAEERETLTAAEQGCWMPLGSSAEDIEQFRALDARFHLTIAELTGIPSLAEAAATTRDRINALLDQIPFIHTNVEHSCMQHARIVEAIFDHDAEAAATLAAQHAEGTEQLLRGFLDGK